MSNEKLDAKLDQASGKAKEVVGDVTNNKELEAEGKAEGLGGKAKELFEDAKDAVEEAAHSTKEAVEGAVEGLKNTFKK